MWERKKVVLAKHKGLLISQSVHAWLLRRKKVGDNTHPFPGYRGDKKKEEGR